MEEEYKNKMCPTCTNDNCTNNIQKTEKQNITIIKCVDYQKTKSDQKQFLGKYIEELKLRRFNNDC